MGFSLFTDLITPTKYKIPDAATVDINKEQLANVESNAASFEAAKGLALDFNQFMQEQFTKRLRENMPEFEGFQQQMALNLGKQLRGELSLGDAAAQQRASAARNLGMGTAGSQFAGGMTLADLGLRQFGVQKAAQAELPTYLQTIAGLKNAPLFNFSSVFMDPAQRIAIEMQNQQHRWNVQNLKNQMKVQPEPWEKALAGFGDSVLDAAVGYFTMGGSLMGGGGIGSGAGSRGAGSKFTVGDYNQQSRMMAESGGMSNPYAGLAFGEQYSW